MSTRRAKPATDHLPTAADAEADWVGCALLDPTLISSSHLAVGDFFDAQLRLIVETMVSLWGDGEKINEVAVINRLKEKRVGAVNGLEAAGGIAFIGKVVDGARNVASASCSEALIVSASKRRRLIALSDHLAQKARGAATDDDLAAAVQDAKLTIDDIGDASRGFTASGARAVTRCMADIAPEPIHWLWPSRIAIGKQTNVCGDPGLGKSFFTAYMAAVVTNGSGWADDRHARREPASVAFLSAEDDPGDTIRPRLDAVGANVRKIHTIEAVRVGKQKRHFDLLRDIETLEILFREIGDCRLLVIDPVDAYLGQTDSHKGADVRGALAPLSALAQRHHVAVVCIRHLNKSEGKSAMYRSSGSLAFVAAARAEWLVAADRKNPTRRLFLPVKNNLAQNIGGLAYSIVEGACAWEEGRVDTSADEALAPEHRGRPDNARDEAAEWLTEHLTDKPLPATEVIAAANRAGIKEKTLRRALKEVGEPFRESFGGPWYWRISSPTPGNSELWPSSEKDAF